MRLSGRAPAAIYVERTYRDAPQMAVETAAGAWDVWMRLDLGRLITSPARGREVAAAAIGRKSTAADQAQAARVRKSNARSHCEIISSREVLLDEYEHALRCDP